MPNIGFDDDRAGSGVARVTLGVRRDIRGQ